ncbi:MAG: hypothetical protein EON58_03130 [Alphaproteobacteria bacterium]|nr:MAG: hypothetical protein EON58_03130 [Alphaproteobacteria bacterium]
MNQNKPPAPITDRDTPEERERRYAYLRCCKPRIEGLPDLGLALEPQEEAELRAYADLWNIDFDEMKAQFEAGHHVVPSRSYGKFSLESVKKRVVPKNMLRTYFLGRMSGRVLFREMHENTSDQDTDTHP